MKVMLASDYIPKKIKLPVIAQPKIDGVRGVNMVGDLTGRSLKKFKNLYIGKKFGVPALKGLDGELAGESETHPDLCRITTSLTGTIKGEPWLMWWLFDYITDQTKHLTYHERLIKLENRYHDLITEAPYLHHHLALIPYRWCHTIEELESYDTENLEAGYEGTCFRDPYGKHKEGRSTPTEGGLLRIKRFVHFEFKVHTIIEGEENLNEAQINELGHTFRSSHQENKLPNGMIGAMLGTTLDDVIYEGKVLFAKGQEVRVGAGCLNHNQRGYYFRHQDEFKALIHKAKFFPKGIKDKPRFPTWQTFRDLEDM